MVVSCVLRFRSLARSRVMLLQWALSLSMIFYNLLTMPYCMLFVLIDFKCAIMGYEQFTVIDRPEKMGHVQPASLRLDHSTIEHSAMGT
jgi:hypothetical protein